MDLFKIRNFNFGWTVDCDGFEQQLRGTKGVRECQRERALRREEIIPATIREQRYISEPIETKYLKFWPLIL
jgi:hypothetical protein